MLVYDEWAFDMVPFGPMNNFGNGVEDGYGEDDRFGDGTGSGSESLSLSGNGRFVYTSCEDNDCSRAVVSVINHGSYDACPIEFAKDVYAKLPKVI